MRACVLWLGLALATDACALTGYDFGDYERAGSATNATAAGAAGEAGRANDVTPFSVGLSGAGDGGAGGAGDPDAACEPQTCFALGLECGPGPQYGKDGCGAELDCGGCFWWFQECRQNTCVIPE
jgi:hypothetical protein